jgi:5-methylthioadenosine/S-adenosylhomocysteine deaminase
MAETLVQNVLLMTDGHAPVRPLRYDVLIGGDRIKAVEPTGTFAGAEVVIEADGYLAAPGLINGHLHSWDYFIKGRVENLPMEVLMAHLRPAKPAPLTDRQVYLRTMMGAIESLRTGATTVVDDLSLGQSFNRGHVEAALQAYDDIGLRAYLGFSMIDKPVVDSWPFVDECFAADILARLRELPRPSGEVLLALVRELARSRHPASSRVGVLVAPSAPHRCTDPFLVACRRLADDCELPVITHCLETRLQVVTAEVFYGRSMVEHLMALGFLKPRTSLIHAVWLTDRDRSLIAEAGASVQYNPWSNSVIGSGVADFQACRAAGINVSMGSDGCGVTFNCSMLNALRVGAALERVRTPDFARWPSAAELWDAATLGGAAALGRTSELGRIAPGLKADLVLYRLDSPGLVPLNDPVRQLVHAETGAGIDTVIVDGAIVLRHGRFERIDAPRLVAEFQAVHADLQGEIMGSEEASRPMLEGVARVYGRALQEPIAEDTTWGWFKGVNAGHPPSTAMTS